MANIITLSRIIFSFGLAFCNPFSKLFYAFYILSGLSDITDGYLARKTDTVSEKGAKLDTIADMIFVFTVFFKIFGYLKLKTIIRIWIILIFTLKLCSIAIGLIKTGKFPSVHSIANKLTGVMLFLYPLLIKILNEFELNTAAVLICCLASYAALDEMKEITAASKQEQNKL